jgi:hypothetical protein
MSQQILEGIDFISSAATSAHRDNLTQITIEDIRHYCQRDDADNKKGGES